MRALLLAVALVLALAGGACGTRGGGQGSPAPTPDLGY